MATDLTLAVIQAPFTDDLQANIAKVARLVREAAGRGAQVILPPELFQGPYFCVRQEERWFATAHPWREHPCVTALAPLAAELGVVLPISIFEREGPHYFNSLVMVDAGGELLGLYRKSHIPDGPGYQEKYYFRPGDTGFRVWDTRHGRLGVGVCWDQWYPEAARAMTLMGAQALLYPTAIGSEPHDPSLDTALPWRRAMQGHAVANVIPVAGANRTGFEPWADYPGGGQGFYGSSFICDHRGDLLADLGRDEEGVGLASFDLGFLDRHRAAWGFFRDRRPDLYGALTAQRPDLIETERLILRRWRAADLDPYAAMMADPEVTDWLGGGQSRAEAEAHLKFLNETLEATGFSILAIERKADGAFVGSAGLAPVREDLPFAPAVEVGWRLARHAWGHGYATEAARAAIDDGFSRLGLGEIVSFTAAGNRRSRAVMERLGLVRDPTRDFDHPRLAPGHPLRPHVVYAALRPA